MHVQGASYVKSATVGQRTMHLCIYAIHRCHACTPHHRERLLLISKHVYIYTYTYMYIVTCKMLETALKMYTNIHPIAGCASRSSMFTYMYIYIHEHPIFYVYIHVRIYMYVYIHVCIYMCVYIYNITRSWDALLVLKCIYMCMYLYMDTRSWDALLDLLKALLKWWQRPHNLHPPPHTHM